VKHTSTHGQRRVNPKEYDDFTTGMGNFIDPTHHIKLTPNSTGWTADEEFATIYAHLARETDPNKRYALWEQQT
jgi:ABC-type transport system substrate-binding protein